MTKVTLGRTGITVPKNGFGALPVQRISFEETLRRRKPFSDGLMKAELPFLIQLEDILTVRKKSVIL